jgi:hypothetical protein
MIFQSASLKINISRIYMLIVFLDHTYRNLCTKCLYPWGFQNSTDLFRIDGQSSSLLYFFLIELDFNL